MVRVLLAKKKRKRNKNKKNNVEEDPNSAAPEVPETNYSEKEEEHPAVKEKKRNRKKKDKKNLPKKKTQEQMKTKKKKKKKKKEVRCFVIDEADRILEANFEEEMKQTRQTALFSATQTKKVEDLARLSFQTTPVYIDLDDGRTRVTNEGLQQAEKGILLCTDVAARGLDIPAVT
ncbi:hypothetical protein L2E82_51343 [Cichorium intybus]|nr:hypothetical protein L2E82_51343 [Cichorium intybus]